MLLGPSIPVPVKHEKLQVYSPIKDRMYCYFEQPIGELHVHFYSFLPGNIWKG